jgi:hypothetical protein
LGSIEKNSLHRSENKDGDSFLSGGGAVLGGDKYGGKGVNELGGAALGDGDYSAGGGNILGGSGQYVGKGDVDDVLNDDIDEDDEDEEEEEEEEEGEEDGLFLKTSVRPRRSS